jgi:nucleoid-associated protein YgaU
MGLIGKIGLIGIIAVAVILAVVWDIHNESKVVAREKTNATESSSLPTAQALPGETPIPGQEGTLQAQPGSLTAGPPTPEPLQPVKKEPMVSASATQVRSAQAQPTSPARTTPQKYTTKKGDTLSSIAKRFYGDGLKWKAIYDTNRELIPNPNFLPVGKEITIPPVDTAEKLATLEHPARTTYIVQKGDTLMKIAEHHYGDPAKWTRIFEANKEKISDKDTLLPGAVLVIPDLSPER